jgi:hypothetical protein
MKSRFFFTATFLVSLVAFGSSNPALAEQNFETYCEGSPAPSDIPRCREFMDNWDKTIETDKAAKLSMMCPPDIDPDDPTGRPRAELCRLGHERDALARMKMKREAREAKYEQILANNENQPSQPEETTVQQPEPSPEVSWAPLPSPLPAPGEPSPQEGNSESESDDGEEFQLSQSTNGSGETNQNNAQGSESADSNLLSGNSPTNRGDATSSSKTSSDSDDSEDGSGGLGAVILLGGFAGIGFGAMKGIQFLISKFKK